MKLPREVADDLRAELDRQGSRFDVAYSPSVWARVVAEEAGEFMRAVNHEEWAPVGGHLPEQALKHSSRDELLQLACVCLRALIWWQLAEKMDLPGAVP